MMRSERRVTGTRLLPRQTNRSSTIHQAASRTANRSSHRSRAARRSRTGPRRSEDAIGCSPRHRAEQKVLRLFGRGVGEGADVGLVQRSIEKFIETKVCPSHSLVDRLDHRSPMCMEHRYLLGIEKLMDWKCPAMGNTARSDRRAGVHHETPARFGQLHHGGGGDGAHSVAV